MKTEVKKIDATQRELNIEESGDIIKNKFEDVFKHISKDAKIPGFRPGHAPRDVLEKHYASYAHEQVMKELVPDIYNQAIEKEKLDVIELPRISEVKLDRSSLSFKAKVEVSPQIQLRDYKKIKLGYKKIEVSPDDIKRSLDALKESRKADSIDDDFARSLGYPGVQELEEVLKRQIYLQKENQQRKKIEDTIVENIQKGVDFKIPQAMVDRQLEDLLRQAKLDLALKGVAKEKIEEEEKTLLERLTPQAKNQVKVYLVLSEIAKKENIVLDDQMPRRVMEFLLKEADWQEV
ncbi:MAG: hypothetical protein JW788_02665 [Candidatus Omnitrophica bacterium]|nr:hypothetical protein [Candidatus Omnitrophota bacterium]